MLRTSLIRANTLARNSFGKGQLPGFARPQHVASMGGVQPFSTGSGLGLAQQPPFARVEGLTGPFGHPQMRMMPQNTPFVSPVQPAPPQPVARLAAVPQPQEVQEAQDEVETVEQEAEPRHHRRSRTRFFTLELNFFTLLGLLIVVALLILTCTTHQRVVRLDQRVMQLEEMLASHFQQR